MKKQTLTLLFLFLLGNTFGEQHCMLDSFGSSIVITNDYSGVEYYKVSYAVTPGVSLSLNEPLGDGFFLIPGEQKTINYNITLPFKGNYSLSFNIVDSKAKNENKIFNYEVFNCHNVDIIILTENDNYCLRQIMPYKVIINNTGKYAENLTLMVNNDPFNLTLYSGEIKEYNLDFYTTNQEDNKITVTAKNEYLTKTIVEPLNLRNCDTTAVVLEELKACPGQLISSTITLKNLGFSQDAYQIINSTNNIIIEPQVLTLDAKEQAIIPYDLIIACDEIGLKTAQINIQSLNSGLIKAKITYEALNCFDFKIENENVFSNYCENDNKTINFNIKNNGLISDSYTGLLIYGNQQTNLNFYLEPKESINLNISEYFNYTGDFNAELIIKSNNYCEKIKSVTENFNIKKINECYNGKLEVQEYFRGFSRVKITNNGTRQNNYTLTVFNQSQINNMSFMLNPGQSKEYQLNNLDSIMNDYDISVFSVNLLANEVNLTSQTSYSNSITGMIILTVKEYYSYAGLILLVILISLFIKNNVLKSRKSNINL
jgi:hypothetical protein